MLLASNLVLLVYTRLKLLRYDMTEIASLCRIHKENTEAKILEASSANYKVSAHTTTG